MDKPEEEENDNHNNNAEKDHYQKLLDKLSCLSKENLRMLKDKAVLRAQMNILEMEKSQINESSRRSKKDNKYISLERKFQENSPGNESSPWLDIGKMSLGKTEIWKSLDTQR
ncbi:hypothetical protein F2Q68_00024971 [Brassica cretica]|uniref:Uncharacterized protein n=1 Tax=Brassica cretica TaxID=69181 RepID=A0A8S9IGZ2_BRACR|nr:hypothetical protein F2Q68_00024971 [Brassica cretica]